MVLRIYAFRSDIASRVYIPSFRGSIVYKCKYMFVTAPRRAYIATEMCGGGEYTIYFFVRPH